MATKAQTLRVGLFAALALVLLAIVLIVFGGLRFWEKSDRYRIVFGASVYGLDRGSQVYLNGIKVGSVEELEIATEDISKAVVVIKVAHGTPVRTDTRAVLLHAGITGLKVIDLRDGTSAAPPLPPGEQIPSEAGLLEKIETEAQRIIARSATLIEHANLLTERLLAISEPAERAATNFAAVTESLQSMVDENRAGLRESIAAIRRAARGTSRLLDEDASRLLVGADGFVSELRKLVATNESSLRAAMFDLRQASRSFKELARDVRQRPSRLLFSGAAEDRKLP